MSSDLSPRRASRRAAPPAPSPVCRSN